MAIFVFGLTTLLLFSLPSPALFLQRFAKDFHMPDRLARLRIDLQDAVFLPGVEQPVILGFARHGLIGRV